MLRLLLVFSLVACTSSAPLHPAPVPVANHNRAVDYAHMLASGASCTPMLELPEIDSAVCDTGLLLLYCHVVSGQAPGCGLVGDFHPKEAPKPDDAPKPEATPVPPVNTATGSAPSASKTDPRPPTSAPTAGKK